MIVGRMPPRIGPSSRPLANVPETPSEEIRERVSPGEFDVRRIVISRKLQVIAAAGAALLLTAGGVGAAQLDKAVNLSVDGTSTATHVFGSTVGDLLESEGITVKDGRRRLSSGRRALSRRRHRHREVRPHAEPHGRRQDPQISTTETTVDGALLALGLRSEGARLSVSRSQSIGRQGLALTVVTPKAVTVVVDGKTTTKTITAATVGEALGQLGVGFGKADKVNPPVHALRSRPA